jgi:hypothetical protein
MHPVELYQRYLKARRNIPPIEMHPTFHFFNSSLYQEQEEYCLISLFLLANDPFSGLGIVNPENVENADITQFLDVDSNLFQYEFSYCKVEDFDENRLNDESWMKHVKHDDPLIHSLLEKIAAIDIIKRANEALT